MVLASPSLNDGEKFFVSAIFVAVPGTFIKKISFYAFVQPCFQETLNDKNQHGTCKKSLVKCFSSFFSHCGYFYVITWGILFLTAGIIMWLTVAMERAAGNLPDRGRLLETSCVDYTIEMHDSCVPFVCLLIIVC